MRRPLVLLAMIVALAMGVAAQPAAAQEAVDISGSWQIDFLDLFDSSCEAVIEQNGGELGVAASCPILGTLIFEGTINPVTGAFGLSSGGISWEGQVLPDGNSLTGTWTQHFFGSTGSLTGERIDDLELIDISGVWDVIFLDDAPDTCRLEIEQGLVSTSAVLDCEELGVASLEGTIDPFNGTFSLSHSTVDDTLTAFIGGPSPDASYITGSELFIDSSGPAIPVITPRSFVAVPAGALERGLVLVGCRQQNLFLTFCIRVPDLQSSDNIRVELAVLAAPAGGYTGVEATLSWPASLAFKKATPSDQCTDAASVDAELSLSITCSLTERSNFFGDIMSFTLTCAGNTGDAALDLDNARFIGSDPDLGPPTLVGARATCLDPRIFGAPPLLGDVDCSQEVTSIDAALILQFVARLVDFLPCQSSGDTTEDTVIDSRDALIILQTTAGLL